MADQLTSVQLTDLADGFFLFSQAVGNFRYVNGNLLSPEMRRQIKDYQWTLLNFADDLYTSSATFIMNEAAETVSKIKEITLEINNTYQDLENFQKAIDIAAAGITVAASIFSKNPKAIADSLQDLIKEWKA